MASRATRPSATSRMIAVAVNVLPVEPNWNSVSSSTGNGFSTLVTPHTARCSAPSWYTPTETPGTASRSADSATHACNVS